MAPLTANVNVAEDTVNSGWDYVYTIGAADLQITWTYGGDCEVTDSVSVSGNPVAYSSYLTSTAISQS